MKALLHKEFTLSFFPLPYCFLLLAGLLLIPNYPYFVIFFYTSLGIMFLFQYHRENRDLAYLLTLPVSRAQMVQSRYVQVVVIQGMQLLVCLPFMALRGLYAQQNNAVGFEANLALLGLGAVQMGLSNLVFLPGFYRNGRSIGIPFLVSSLVQAAAICAFEVSLRVVPYFVRYCDSMAWADQLHQIPILAGGLALYAGLTWGSLRLSLRRFVQLDL